MILDQISQQNKILILGFAREGQSTKNFLHTKYPSLQIDTADKKDGLNYLSNLTDYQIVIKSPGITPYLPEIITAKKNGVIFTSQTQIFFEECPAKIIGVTGTKGKSTTSSLIYHVLSTNGINSHLVGNIGKPSLDYLDSIKPSDWVVMELSSYQLMDLNKSPHIAILLNIYPDHLDYHLDYEEYKTAKLNITKYQTPNDFLITAIDIPTLAKKIIIQSEPVDSQLLGTHNLCNIKPSIIIGEMLNISKEKIFSSIKSFTPLDTRLTNVGTINGITFYEDTLATIPEATIAAIDALNSGVKTLIAGGHERKQNYSNLAKKILNSNISTLILFPATGERIAKEVNQLLHAEEMRTGAQGVPSRNSGMVAEHPQSHSSNAKIHIFNVTSMPEAVKLAYANTPKGSLVLLSPAAPSFTLFKDYRDESAQYRQAISCLT